MWGCATQVDLAARQTVRLLLVQVASLFALAMALEDQSTDVSDECVRRAASGDRDAQREILETYATLVRGMLYRLTGNSDELDDLFQSVCIEILQSIGKFRFGSSVSTWIGGICINVARNFYRNQKSRGVLRRRSSGSIQTADARHAKYGSSSAMEAQLMLRKAIDALDVLSYEQRAVLVLRTLYGYSIKEIANITSSATSTTRMRLYYARKKFVTSLKREGLVDKTAELLPKLEQG